MAPFVLWSLWLSSLPSCPSDGACKEQHTACAGRAVGAALPQLPRLILTQVCESCTQWPWEQTGQGRSPLISLAPQSRAARSTALSTRIWPPHEQAALPGEMQDAQGNPTLAGKSGGVIRTNRNTVCAALFLENALISFFKANLVLNPYLRELKQA